MKNSIKLTALLLLASAGVFAATPSKTKASLVPPTAAVTFSSMPSQKGVEVKLNESAKAIVIITDQDGNVLRKDILSNNKGLEKGYVLNKLDNGDYTIEVTTSGQIVKKVIHVYDEGQTKMFIING
jgi:hypothetical protein